MRATIYGVGAAACLAVGLVASGWQVSMAISDAPVVGATETLPAQTIVRNHTRIVKRVVRGRVVTLAGGQRVVRVPLVVIHNLRCHPTRRHPCVRRVVVPAHTIPLRAATLAGAPIAVAAVATPVTVYATVTLPAVTVTLPPIVQTVTDTTTATSTTEVTVTVTVPLQPGGAS